MRSKWLDWTPEASSVGFDGSQSVVFPIVRASESNRTPLPSLSPDAIIKKVAGDEPTKPTKPGATAHSEVSAARPQYFWGRHEGYYGWRANVALDAICGILSPEGLSVWLREHSPFLYAKLTRDLPDRISRAWDSQIPFEGFDALCLDLVDTYQRAAELYRK
jgi:hypothetical protein